ncbi:hypothetical protein B0H14DRAFT_2649788 [Mycena olivaceomarginata]|nr:hypothetical protein B0H14DRAFT_2649788 [Mycena olivaceomarginata]
MSSWTSFIPELIVHSKNQDEEQVPQTRYHYDLHFRCRASPDTFESLETLQDNKLAIVCNKLDLKPTDRLLLRLGHPRGLRRQNLQCYPRQESGEIWHREDSSERDPQSVHCARMPHMTLTWDTGGRVGQGQGHKKLQRGGVSRDIRQLNRRLEYPTASLLLSIAMKLMTTQTDSNAAKMMALDHLGVIAARIRSISAKGRAGGAEPEDIHTLVSIKLALKYTQLREVESMRAIAWAHQDCNLADFEKAPRDHKDKLSSELTICSHLTALYNTLLESPSLCPTLLSPLSTL